VRKAVAVQANGCDYNDVRHRRAGSKQRCEVSRAAGTQQAEARPTPQMLGRRERRQLFRTSGGTTPPSTVERLASPGERLDHLRTEATYAAGRHQARRAAA
jgi:hypothetical protein